MIVRKFLLENEKGQQLSMNNYKKTCLFISPSNLGYSNKIEFQKLENTFIEEDKSIEQKNPSGTVCFNSYDTYREFVDFIESSVKLKFVYIIPFKDREKLYYKDVKIKEIGKTEKEAGMLKCQIAFYGLSLWYEENTTKYTIKPQEDELRWDFRWNSRFKKYNTRNLQYRNNGHVEAPIEVAVEGPIANLKIQLFVEEELAQEVHINTEIAEYEKILYGTKENDFYINKQNTDGTLESLFSLDVLDFENEDVVVRIPKNKSCELRLVAENEIKNAQITILTFYKTV